MPAFSARVCIRILCILCLIFVSALATGDWCAYAKEEQSRAAMLRKKFAARKAEGKASAFRSLVKPTAQNAKNTASASRLFGTVEFKGPIKALPKWKRILDSIAQHGGSLTSILPAKGSGHTKASWSKFKSSLNNINKTEQLAKVNAFFNTMPYRLDQEVWGQSDYWATPDEFLAKSGDCEDYSITKFYALKELGFSAESMRIAVVKDMIRGIGHAVLVVYLNDEAWVLDNQTKLVLPHTRYNHYIPQYSVNEHFRWAHIPAKAK